MNVAGNLEVSASLFPDRPALREGAVEVTYAELNDRASRMASGLAGAGLRPGELVGFCARNSIDWITFYFAVLKTGAVAVTLSSQLTGDELMNLLSHARPKLVYGDESKLGDLQQAKASGIIDRIICPGSGLTLEDLADTGSGTFRTVDRERTDTAAVLYTGGTTGLPKGVMLKHEGINFSAYSIAFYERSTEKDVALCFLPFNHVFGQMHIMNSTILSSGCLELLPAFDMDPVLKILQAGRITKFFAVPTVYIRLLGLPDLKEKIGELRYCFSAGASMALETVRQWKERTGITISESYGMTECMPITFNHFFPERHVVGTVGQACHSVEVQIRDTAGNLVEHGHEGEICVRSPACMKGYLDNPEATEAAFWQGGWVRSGDIGIMDDKGYVSIVDRLKDLIITGGENVFPREVEEALYTLPEVEECAVIGAPDKEWGERVIAVVVPKKDQSIVPKKVKSVLKGMLSPFKIPKEYVIVKEMPKSAAGKILKRELKKSFLEGRNK